MIGGPRIPCAAGRMQLGHRVCGGAGKGTFDDVRDTYLTAAGAARVQAWCTDALDRWPAPHSIVSLDTCFGTTDRKSVV